MNNYCVHIGIVILIFSLSSCGVNQDITYTKYSIDQHEEKEFPHLTLGIDGLVDKRFEFKENNSQFEERRFFRKEDIPTCVNSERHYIDGTVSEQITHELINHWNLRNTFNKVVNPDDNYSLTDNQVSSSDYYVEKKTSPSYFITADLTHFYGEQPYESSIFLGRLIIGRISNIVHLFSEIKVRGTFHIRFENIKLYNQNRELIKDMGEYSLKYNDTVDANAYCWCVYDNVNLMLRDFMEGFMQMIEDEIKSIENKKEPSD